MAHQRRNIGSGSSSGWRAANERMNEWLLLGGCNGRVVARLRENRSTRNSKTRKRHANFPSSALLLNERNNQALLHHHHATPPQAHLLVRSFILLACLSQSTRTHADTQGPSVPRALECRCPTLSLSLRCRSPHPPPQPALSVVSLLSLCCLSRPCRASTISAPLAPCCLPCNRARSRSLAALGRPCWFLVLVDFAPLLPPPRSLPATTSAATNG